jgi:hypothetical protein
MGTESGRVSCTFNIVIPSFASDQEASNYAIHMVRYTYYG